MSSTATMILLAFLVLWAQMAVAGGEACNFTSPLTVWVQEGTENGTCVQQFSDDHMTIMYYDSNPSFLHVVNGTLCLNATLDLDNNQALCTHLEKNGMWNLYVTCDDGVMIDNHIVINVNTTDNYPPMFSKTNFSKKIQEMAEVGTTIAWFKNADITDRDCYNTLRVKTTTKFSIEGGNTENAFRLASERTGELVVSRWLDYESGDRHFLLNISVADNKTPNRKSYTTVEVSVLNIDDSDPEFGATSYQLHVTEEDNSTVVWLLTDPPVSVLDPDHDDPDPDSLVLSLYDSGDESKVKVNGSGAVQLQTTFDHEQTPELTVVLKVHKKDRVWMSSTATLTLVIEDVNDNRPRFDPSVYHFTIAEHSARLSAVGLVYATDRDSGANAVFNYTLLSHDAVFMMETHGGGLSGVLRVRNSTLLDREDSHERLVTIGTQELRPEEGGGGCSGGQCRVTVKVTLLDINDNSPVFDQSSYNATVQDYVANDVIIKVQASDADEGDRGDVVYSLQGYGSSGVCADVMVNVTSGDVSMANSVREAVQCSVLVYACDSPLDPQHRRCTSVPLQVSLHISNHTVVLQTSVAPQVLIPHSQELQRRLSDILGVSVRLIHIATNSTTQGSDVLISATNTTTQETLSRQHLQQLADGQRQRVRQLFLSYQPSLTTPTTSRQNIDDDFPPHVIALIVVAGLLLVALIVAVVVIHKTRKGHKRQERLMRRLTTTTSDIYACAELGVDNITTINDDGGKTAGPQDDTSIGGFSSTTPTLPLIIDDDDDDDEGGRRRPGLGMGVINPIFQDEEEEDPSLPHLTPRSHTEDGGVGMDGAGGVEGQEEEEGGTGTKGHGGRCPDADSGVPSDRENGGGEGESGATSRDTPPVLPRGVGATLVPGESVGAAYLDAVLRGLVTSSVEDGGEGGDVADMVDVASSPPAGFPDEAGSDRLHAGVPLPPPPPPLLERGSLLQTVTRGSAEGPAVPSNRVSVTRITISGDEDIVEIGEVSGPAPAPHATPDPTRLLGAILQEHLRSQQQSQERLTSANDGGGEDDNDNHEDEDALGLGSKLGQLVRPSTPPMHRARSREDEEDDEEGVPDEPEPDYAKKVHFNALVVEMQRDDHANASQDPSQQGKGQQLPDVERTSKECGESLSDDLGKAGEGSPVAKTVNSRGGGEEREADSHSSTLLVRPLREGKGSRPPPVSETVQERAGLPLEPQVGSGDEELTAF